MGRHTGFCSCEFTGDEGQRSTDPSQLWHRVRAHQTMPVRRLEHAWSHLHCAWAPPVTEPCSMGSIHPCRCCY